MQDPSLSHATQKPIHNLLGFPGAIFSDLAMQLLGLASIVLLLPETLLGWWLLAHKPLVEKWRGLLWIVATFLAAGFASTLPRIGTWPLPTGLGGVLGDALLHVPALLLGAPLSRPALIVLSVLFGLATVVTLAIAAGMRWPYPRAEQAARADRGDVEDEDAGDDRASAWLGMIVHSALSWKARLGRWLRGTPRAPLRTAMPAATGGRQEPRFDSFGRVAMPVATEAEEEYEEEAQRRAAARRRAYSRAVPAAAIRCRRSSADRAACLRTHHAVEGHHRQCGGAESVLGDFGVRGEIIKAHPVRW